MKIHRLVLVASVLLCATPAFAWNSHGHMTVAAVAYKKLRPGVRMKVDALVRLNPDYPGWVTNVSAGNRDQVAFVMAATWPDMIKHEAGYTNDGDHPTGPDAARNIGYADKLQHKYWHYIDIPFSPDGTPLKQPLSPNARTQITAFRAVLASPSTSDDLKSYDLVWLLHLVGDVHQPLHCTTRFDYEQLDGDRGGNLVALCAAPCKNELHAFWDDLLGTSTDPKAAIRKADELLEPDPHLTAIADPATWIEQSFEAATMAVYVDPIGIGHGPFTVDSKYEKEARARALKMVALAGVRLANLLNDSLKTVVLGAHAHTDEHLVGVATERMVMFNQHALKFHDPNCVWAHKCTRNCVSIPLSEAIRRGGVPCKVCGGGG
jgi:hypothetical protein